MKISGSAANYINNAYTGKTNPAAVPAKTGRQADELKADNIELSATTKVLQKISQAMETEPADRAQQVSSLKEQVQAGQYDVNALKVAEKMMLGFNTLA
jgi:flagellar biosynthesis anti-sigma factor FlgM